MSPDDPRHGTVNGYSNRNCRCEKCRAAWTAYNLRRRNERKAVLAPDDPRHGQENTYYNHKCRCDRCRQAHADAARLRRNAANA